MGLIDDQVTPSDVLQSPLLQVGNLVGSDQLRGAQAKEVQHTKNKNKVVFFHVVSARIPQTKFTEIMSSIHDENCYYSCSPIESSSVDHGIVWYGIIWNIIW